MDEDAPQVKPRVEVDAASSRSRGPGEAVPGNSAADTASRCAALLVERAPEPDAQLLAAPRGRGRPKTSAAKERLRENVNEAVVQKVVGVLRTRIDTEKARRALNTLTGQAMPTLVERLAQRWLLAVHEHEEHLLLQWLTDRAKDGRGEFIVTEGVVVSDLFKIAGLSFKAGADALDPKLASADEKIRQQRHRASREAGARGLGSLAKVLTPVPIVAGVAGMGGTAEAATQSPPASSPTTPGSTSYVGSAWKVPALLLGLMMIPLGAWLWSDGTKRTDQHVLDPQPGVQRPNPADDLRTASLAGTESPEIQPETTTSRPSPRQVRDRHAGISPFRELAEQPLEGTVHAGFPGLVQGAKMSFHTNDSLEYRLSNGHVCTGLTKGPFAFLACIDTPFPQGRPVEGPPAPALTQTLLALLWTGRAGALQVVRGNYWTVDAAEMRPGKAFVLSDARARPPHGWATQEWITGMKASETIKSICDGAPTEGCQVAERRAWSFGDRSTSCPVSFRTVEREPWASACEASQ